jgi:outer membrane PBP1 activator LpoA protein
MFKAKNPLSLISVLACVLAACTTQTNVTRGIDIRAVESQAERAAQTGDALLAATLYAQLANATSGAAKSAYLIDSARQSIAGGDAASARLRLGEARTGAVSEQQQAIVVLLAGLEIDAGRPQAAFDMLAAVPQTASLVAQRDGAAVRARALFALHRYADAVRTLVAREVWLDDSAAIAENQRLLWNGFRENPPRPGEAAPTTGDVVVDGWLGLAPIAAAEQSEAEQRAALIAWRERYPTHPAANRLLGELLAPANMGNFPRQIALLLPVNSTSADYRFPAEAIRDSFLLSYWGDPSHSATAVRIYDTAANGSASAYRLAQIEGAEFIVGPLLRSEVAEVLPLLGTVPTLALNLAPAESQVPSAFYQFSLAPEDEARAAARRAIADGARTAVALVPIDAASDRPIRILTAFRDEFEALGGRLLESRAYEPQANQFSPEITDLFNINDSERRHAALESALGTQLDFVPRPRRDVDAIFLSAFPGPGRTLRAELAAHTIGVPIYSTSDIFLDPAAGPDNDLNDIVFADMPVVIAPNDAAAGLRRQIEQFWPDRNGQVRYFGMGFDAYELVRMLYSDGVQAGPLEGMSGDLHFDAYNRVRRGLPTARFSRGRPVQLETAAAPDATPLAGTR